MRLARRFERCQDAERFTWFLGRRIPCSQLASHGAYTASGMLLAKLCQVHAKRFALTTSIAGVQIYALPSEATQ